MRLYSSEGYLRLRFGGLIFRRAYFFFFFLGGGVGGGRLGGAFYRNFSVSCAKKLIGIIIIFTII